MVFSPCRGFGFSTNSIEGLFWPDGFLPILMKRDIYIYSSLSMHRHKPFIPLSASTTTLSPPGCGDWSRVFLYFDCKKLIFRGSYDKLFIIKILPTSCCKATTVNGIPILFEKLKHSRHSRIFVKIFRRKCCENLWFYICLNFRKFLLMLFRSRPKYSM